MMRQTFAVLAGFAVWTVFWLAANIVLKAARPEAFQADGGVSEPGLLVLMLLVSVGLSLLAGFTAASMSAEKEMRPVLALAAIQVAIGTAVEIGYWSVIPAWYHIAFIALLAPAIIGGGRIALTRKMRSAYA